MSTATHRHGFTCTETVDHADYQGKHRDDTREGKVTARVRDNLAVRASDHPLAAYVGKHRAEATS